MSQEVIEFSSQVVAFSKEKTFSLEIRNNSPTQSFIFKIKTTKLNTYDVKPPLGWVHSNQKKVIEFKIVKPMNADDENEARNKDKFQLQFLMTSPSSIPKTKEEIKKLWNDAKQDPSKQASFCNFTFPVQLYDELNTRPAGRGLSSEMSQKSAVRKVSSSGISNRDDSESARQFQKLKEEEQRLVAQRQNLFKQQPKTAPAKGSKSKKQLLIIIAAFLVSLVIGNFLRLRVFVSEEL